MRTTILETKKKNTQNGIKIDQAFQKKGLVNLETQQWKLQKAQKQKKKKRQKKWTQHNDFKERVKKKILKEIIAISFPNLMKTLGPQIQGQ